MDGFSIGALIGGGAIGLVLGWITDQKAVARVVTAFMVAPVIGVGAFVVGLFWSPLQVCEPEPYPWEPYVPDWERCRKMTPLETVAGLGPYILASLAGLAVYATVRGWRDSHKKPDGPVGSGG